MFYNIFAALVLIGCAFLFFCKIFEFYKLMRKRAHLSLEFSGILFKDIKYYQKKRLLSFEYFSKLQEYSSGKNLKHICFINYNILESLQARKLNQDALENILKQKHRIIFSLSEFEFKVNFIEDLLESIKECDSLLEKLFVEFKKLLKKYNNE